MNLILKVIAKMFIYGWPCQIAFSVCLLLSVSCSEKQFYPDKPQIVKSSLHAFKYIPTPAGKGIEDSIIIGIQVRDGDGNLGIDEPVPSSEAIRFIGKGNWTNYKILTLRMIGNKFEIIEPPISRDVVFFPKLLMGNSTGATEGYLYFNKIFVYSKSFVMSATKFQIQIRDNSLNESNIVETDTVIVPYQQ